MQVAWTLSKTFFDDKIESAKRVLKEFCLMEVERTILTEDRQPRPRIEWIPFEFRPQIWDLLYEKISRIIETEKQFLDGLNDLVKSILDNKDQDRPLKGLSVDSMYEIFQKAVFRDLESRKGQEHISLQRLNLFKSIDDIHDKMKNRDTDECPWIKDGKCQILGEIEIEKIHRHDRCKQCEHYIRFMNGGGEDEE